MLTLADAGGLDAETGRLIVDMAATLAGEFGATEDYLVTREFKAISTMEERERLLRCCFLVMAADDEIDATESWLANRMAEELDVERPDLNAIREEFHDKLSGVRAVREVTAGLIRDLGRPSRGAGSPQLQVHDPVAHPSPDLGDELGVVGHAPQLHRQRRATGRRHVDDDPRGPRALAQHRLERVHRGHDPVRPGLAREADVEDGARRGLHRAGRGLGRRDVASARASSGSGGVARWLGRVAGAGLPTRSGGSE